MKVAVTGAGGQLGRELTILLKRRGHECIPLSHSLCDIVDQGSIVRMLDGQHPDAVINCAAWTRVDDAEIERVDSYALNAVAPKLLARECAQRNVWLVHVSTDFVFDGTLHHPIDESVIPHPINEYGRGKLDGEHAIQQETEKYQIVRTSWLYGQSGPNFVLTMLKFADQGKQIRVVSDQWGTPTWTGHCGEAIVTLLERHVTGVFHVANSGSTNWFEFACRIMEFSGHKNDVVPISSSNYASRAIRPGYTVLDNKAWRELGEAPLPSWEEGLRRYLIEIGKWKE